MVFFVVVIWLINLFGAFALLWGQACMSSTKYLDRPIYSTLWFLDMQSLVSYIWLVMNINWTGFTGLLGFLFFRKAQISIQ